MTEGEYIVGTDGNSGHWLTGEPIVRCRDCKYMETVDLSSHFGGDHKHDQQECNRVRSFDCFFMPIELDGFCAWGEMRDDHD
ncbi:MAG: hypothetical protein HXK26_05630 [Lancefieldella rimae]|uniref:Uncharacterized protein n=1 Tax=Lancefieldella rimae TaxID=1383 RepID=A0A930W488_9ACTN|nr:hypothetical protein [Lancefieldella rimae]